MLLYCAMSNDIVLSTIVACFAVGFGFRAMFTWPKQYPVYEKNRHRLSLASTRVSPETLDVSEAITRVNAFINSKGKEPSRNQILDFVCTLRRTETEFFSRKQAEIILKHIEHCNCRSSPY